jgi:hypothetical protein
MSPGWRAVPIVRRASVSPTLITALATDDQQSYRGSR